MSKPRAIRGTYADWRLVKTRGVVQIVIEVPLAEADGAYEVMGGMPQPASEKWFAIAAIKEGSAKPEPESPHAPQPARAKREHRDWRDVPPSEQAFLRCQDVAFVCFLREEWHLEWEQSEGADPAADCVRLICGIQSRAELNTDHRSRVLWKQLDDQFQAWMRVGA